MVTPAPPSPPGPERVPLRPDPALKAWVARTAHGEAFASRLGAARLRLTAKQSARQGSAGPEMAVVEDHALGQHLTARLYRPRLASLPVVVYLHGGGFVVGDLDSHDRVARRLAHLADVTVLAVDYRRAPEHPSPAAVEDAIRAVSWADAMLGLLGGDERAGIGVAGDSAGGLLAAAAAVGLQRGAEAGESVPAGHLLLMTPMTDLSLTSPAVTEKGHGWGLERGDLEWYVEQWAPDRGARLSPEISPLYAPLATMPPTFVATAEHDPLRDDGMWFAERLRAAGRPVEHLHFEHLVHGFLQLDDVSPLCAQAGDLVLRRYGLFVRESLGLADATDRAGAAGAGGPAYDAGPAHHAGPSGEAADPGFVDPPMDDPLVHDPLVHDPLVHDPSGHGLPGYDPLAGDPPT